MMPLLATFTLFPYTTLFRSPFEISKKLFPRHYESQLQLTMSEAIGQLDYLLRSEEHTSELQSRGHLVCRLLLEKKNEITYKILSNLYIKQPLELTPSL